MSLPPEDVIQAEIDYIKELAEQVGKDYRWAKNVGYQRANGQAEKVKGSGVSDPVGMTVVSTYHANARSAARRAAKLTRQARMTLQGAVVALENALREPGAPSPTDNAFVPPITEAEYEAALDAQARREQRGEGFGDG